ncbi:MAG: DUF3987 domain-containing protein [Nitrososphaeria archaeon]
MADDVIDMYISYASKSTDAPLIYHKAMGYLIVSILLGRYVRIYTTYNRQGIMPNIWVLLIGPSRIVRKTTAMNLGTSIVESIDENLIMPASFTPEALYEMFTGFSPGDALLWVKDEFGGFFKMLQKKYMAGMREILSSLYVGQGEVRKLRNLTFRIPKGLYICVVGTMPTPPHYYLSEEDFSSGFLNRFVLAYALMRDQGRRIPVLHRSKEVEEERQTIIEQLVSMIEVYSSQAIIPVVFSSQAQKIIDEYDIDVERELYRMEREQPTNLFKLYLAESPTLFLKLAVLRRLARKPYPSTSVLVVDENDCVKAYEDLKAFLDCAKKVIEDVQLAGEAKPIVTEEKGLERIYSYIKSKGYQGATLSDILLNTRILKKDLAEYIITLVEQGRIIAVKKQNQPKGRKPIVFYASDFYVHSEGDQILDVDVLKVLLK